MQDERKLPDGVWDDPEPQDIKAYNKFVEAWFDEGSSPDNSFSSLEYEYEYEPPPPCEAGPMCSNASCEYTPNIRQSITGESTSSTIDLNLTNDHVKNSLLVLLTSRAGNITSVTDDASPSLIWSKAVELTTGGYANLGAAIYVAEVPAGDITVTVARSDAPNEIQCQLLEMTGADLSETYSTDNSTGETNHSLDNLVGDGLRLIFSTLSDTFTIASNPSSHTMIKTQDNQISWRGTGSAFSWVSDDPVDVAGINLLFTPRVESEVCPDPPTYNGTGTETGTLLQVSIDSEDDQGEYFFSDRLTDDYGDSPCWLSEYGSEQESRPRVGIETQVDEEGDTNYTAQRNIWLLFRGIDIPNESIIHKATLDVVGHAADASSGTIDIKYRCFSDAELPINYTGMTGSFDTGFIPCCWDKSEDTAFTVSVGSNTSADIAEYIHTIVNLPYWESGNNIVLYLTDWFEGNTSCIADEDCYSYFTIEGFESGDTPAELSIWFDPKPIGGLLASGASNYSSSGTPNISGGVVCGGTAHVGGTIQETASGGIKLSGEAEEHFIDFLTPSGGSIVGGTASSSIEYNVEGGTVAGGNELPILAYNPSVDGGAKLDGTAIIFSGIPVGGGCLTSGTATVTTIYNSIDVDGGILCNPASSSYGSSTAIITGGVLIKQPTFDNLYTHRTTLTVPASKVENDIEDVVLRKVFDVPATPASASFLVTDSNDNAKPTEVREWDGDSITIYWRSDLSSSSDNVFYLYSRGN